MSDFGVLCRMRLALLANTLRRSTAGQRLKTAIVLALTAALLYGEARAATFVFSRLKAHEDLSAYFVLALIEHLLSLVFLTSLTMLIFSNAITALQTLYLSRDLDLLRATPAGDLAVFAAKFIESVAVSSYMVVAFTAPIMIGYGRSFAAGPAYYLEVLPAILVYVLVPAGVGVAVTIALMRFFPARRAYQALTVVTLGFGVTLVVLLRLTRPERLIRPAGSEDLLNFLRDITLPAADFLPSSWSARLAMAAIGGDGQALLKNAALLVGAAAASLAVVVWAARTSYGRGLAEAHDVPRRSGSGAASRPLSVMGRDARIFFRDSSQWSQLLLLGALIIVYVFNITALPSDMLVVEDLRLKDIVAWLNGALAGLVLAALGLRFVLPATSFEGQAFWTVLSAPRSLGRYLRDKLVFFLPLVAFAEILVVLANLVLGVDVYMMALTVLTAGLASLALIGLGVGLGASYPVFKLENPAQIMFTSAGLLYGVVALAYLSLVVSLEAAPVWRHLVGAEAAVGGDLRRLGLLFLLSAAVGCVPLAVARRRLARLEL